jgi:O-antigen ligase
VSTQPAFLAIFLTATLAAFGGIYPWTTLPMLAGAVLLCFASWVRGGHDDPYVGVGDRSAETRWLDLAIVSVPVAMTMQLVPLPEPLRSAISPHLAEAEAVLRPDAALRLSAFAPLSLDPRGGWQAVAVVAAAALTYFAARRIFSMGGIRRVCRVTAVVGAVAAIEAILQRLLSPTRIYGFWQPQDAAAVPFGPVVNRNHFAAWLVMAAAVTAGYLVARINLRTDSGRAGRSWRGTSSTLLRPPALWTAVSAGVMSLTIVAAQSRSAVIALAVALLVLLRTISRSWSPVFIAMGTTAAVVIMLLGAGESTTTRLAARFAETLEARDVSRVTIWRETLPIASDFAVAGVGAGAFSHAMLKYQQTQVFVPHLGTEWHFNQAHNHYLQLLAEGGLLLTVPAAIVAIAFIRVVRRRLRHDAGELRTVRLGAVAGLAGVAVQSLWDVPLTMPAAAMLAATRAALATYPTRRARDINTKDTKDTKLAL